jgi:stress response protein SCP2
MATQVTRGQEVVLPAVPQLTLRVEGKGKGRSNGNPAALDASAFVLTRVGHVLSERHFVFYGNESTPESSLRWQSLEAGIEEFAVSLPKLPEVTDGIVVTGSLYDAAAARVSLSDLDGAAVRVLTGSDDTVLQHELPPLPPGTTFDAAILAILVRRGKDWVFRAAGDANDGGLAGLATAFGVVVS